MVSLVIACGVLLLLVIREEEEKGSQEDSKKNTLWLAFMLCGFAALPLMLCGVVWPLLRCCLRGLCKDCCAPEEPEAAEVSRHQAKKAGFATTISWLEASVERQHGRIPSSRPTIDPIGAGFVHGETEVQAYDPSQYLAARVNAMQAQPYRTPAASASTTRAATPQVQGAFWAPEGAVLGTSAPSSFGGAFSAGALGGYAVHEVKQPAISSRPEKWEPRPTGSQPEAWRQAPQPASPLSAWLQTSQPGAVGSVVRTADAWDENWGRERRGSGENMNMQHSSLPAVPESREFGSQLHGDLELLDCD